MTTRINQKTVTSVSVSARRDYIEIATGSKANVPSDVILVEVSKVDEFCKTMQQAKELIIKK